MPFRMSRFTFLVLMLSLWSRLFGHVALDYPQGGETFIQGQSVTIQWHIVATHPQLNWDLYFSQDGGENWQPIQLDIPVDSLSYTWIVPAVVTAQGRIKIFQDNVEHDYLDVSMDFNIVPNTSPPFLDAPANNMVIECSSSQESDIQSWLENHGGAAATHYCGELVWTNDYAGLSDECGSTGSSLVVFTAEDDCGSTYTVATVTVVDNSPPSINTFPHDLEVECDGQGNVSELNAWLSDHGGAAASDVCGNVSWSNNFSGVGGSCGMAGQSMVTFTATDACGNHVSTSATFVISDHVAPQIISMARDTILECGISTLASIQSWLNNHAGAQATDICSHITWSNNYLALSDSCGNTGEALIIFSATDDCGNVSTTSATITIQDHTPPVIDSLAKDLIVECGSVFYEDRIQNWLDDHGDAEAVDQCGNVFWMNDFAVSIDSCLADSILVTFIAADDCGNMTSTQSWLINVDTTIQTNDTTVFAPIGATWYYSNASFAPPWSTDPLYCLFLVEKDTFMLGYHARVIGCYVNVEGHLERRNELTKYVAAIGQKVFYKVGDEFVLLYDFGAQAGDTIYSKVEPFELSLGCISPDTIIDFSYVIDSVALHLVDGENLIAQFVSSIHQSPGLNWGFWDFIPIYERLGNWGWGGFWWGTGMDGCILEGGYLKCYIDDQITWHQPGFNESYACDYLYAGDAESEKTIPIFPNPTSGLFTLSEHARVLSIYSLEGKEVNFISMENRIDLSGNPAGLYVVKFEVEKQVYFSKIVLE